MTFRSRNTTSRFVKMGDDTSKGQLREVVGRLMDIRPSPKFPSNPLYDIRRDDGTMVSVAGTTTINNNLNKSDVGKRVRLVYRGEISGSSGAVYRDIEVCVDDADLPVQVPGVSDDGALNSNIPPPERAPEDESSDDLPF